MKILAQGSSSLDKMIREAALAAPDLVSRCLERLDAALFFELGKETFGGGRRFEAVRLDRRAVGVVSFKRRHYIDRALGRRCHPPGELIGLSPRSRVSDEMRLKVIEAASPSSLGSLGKPYEDRVKYDIDTSEMSYGMRKLFSQIEYGVL